jgi:transposase
MCRIAGLFLLQKLKESGSGVARNFNNIETRSVIKLFYVQHKAPKEIHVIQTETLGENSPWCATVNNWVAQFKRGDFFNRDAPGPGRPKTVTTEIIDQIRELIFEHRRPDFG